MVSIQETQEMIKTLVDAKDNMHTLEIHYLQHSTKREIFGYCIRYKTLDELLTKKVFYICQIHQHKPIISYKIQLTVIREESLRKVIIKTRRGILR